MYKRQLIQKLNISADLIFCPENPSKDSAVANLLRMLSAYDERSLEVVKAAEKALINIIPEKQLQVCFLDVYKRQVQEW